jgi:hypothetical protein
MLRFFYDFYAEKNMMFKTKDIVYPFWEISMASEWERISGLHVKIALCRLIVKEVQDDTYILVVIKGMLVISRCYIIVLLKRRGEWNELTGHSKDNGKNRWISWTNSLQQRENYVGWKLTPTHFNDEDVNSKVNSLQPGEDDVDWKAKDSIKKSDDLHLMSNTKKVITRVSNIELDQSQWRWKANSKIYKVMFHEIWLSPMFTRSKRDAKSSLEVRSRHDFFVSGHHLFYFILCTFCLCVQTQGMPSLDTIHKFIIPTLICIFIRFRD